MRKQLIKIATRTIYLEKVLKIVVNDFTRAEWKRKSCMDYVLASLVYENFAIFARIVEDEVRGVVEKIKFIAQLSGIEKYLKFSVVAHIGTDGDIINSTGRSLHTNTMYTDTRTSWQDARSIRSLSNPFMKVPVNSVSFLTRFFMISPSPGVVWNL